MRKRLVHIEAEARELELLTLPCQVEAPAHVLVNRDLEVVLQAKLKLKAVLIENWRHSLVRRGTALTGGANLHGDGVIVLVAENC